MFGITVNKICHNIAFILVLVNIFTVFPYIESIYQVINFNFSCYIIYRLHKEIEE